MNNVEKTLNILIGMNIYLYVNEKGLLTVSAIIMIHIRSSAFIFDYLLK
jgi:hypothetical protein